MNQLEPCTGLNSAAREGHGPARPVSFSTLRSPARPVARQARPSPARLCFSHCGPDRPGPSIYVMRKIAISIVKQLATAKSCFSCIQDILLMSERCQTVSSSGPYLVQVVSDFRSNEQPGPARPVAGLGPARPGPFSTHYFQARPGPGPRAARPVQGSIQYHNLINPPSPRKRWLTPSVSA